jgi:2-dehydro-3-deoxygalactonokinase
MLWGHLRNITCMSAAPNNEPSFERVRLLALDWGTSNLRASLLGDQGQVLATRSAASGVMAVQGGQFERALQTLCGDWLAQQPLPVIASGMIGSRQGWREAAYLPCPATPAQAAAQMLVVTLRDGQPMYIVPGLRCTGRDGQHDVMRGEETQCWGAALGAGSCCLLPGTHSKWVWSGHGGAIEHFQTYMTGELFAVLKHHSILGRLMEAGPPQPQAFAEGAQLGLREHANLLHLLFGARTAGLLGGREPQALADYLSGLLIGAEVGSMCAQAAISSTTLIGDGALNERYALVLSQAGIACQTAAPDATTRGQWRLAQAAHLVGAG